MGSFVSVLQTMYIFACLENREPALTDGEAPENVCTGTMYRDGVYLGTACLSNGV